MTKVWFGQVAVIAAVFATGGCCTMSHNRCGKNSTRVYPAPSSAPCYACEQGAISNGSAPIYNSQPVPMPLSAPSPMPPSEMPVPPPPNGAARPSTIQRMRHATTDFFRNTNDTIRSSFVR